MELERKLDELGTAFTEFKKINDERLKQIEEKGKSSADNEEKMQKAEKHMQDLEKRIEELKTALNRGPGSGKEDGKSEDVEMAKKYNRAINTFMRKGVDVPEELKTWAMKKTIADAQGMGFDTAELEEKAMSVQSDEDGGFLVSPEMSSEVTKTIFETSPIMQLASKQTISSDSLEILYDSDESDAGWVGETQARTGNQGTPQIKKIIIPVHEMFANPPASQKLLDDAAINVEQWLKGKVSEKFERTGNTAFVNGNGVLKPMGILSYDSGTSFNQIERVETAANNAFDGNDFIGVQSYLKEGYQPNASWLMNRLIVAAVRKLKDTTSGQYIWQPGLSAGQPNQLLGKPVYFATDLPSAIQATTDMVIYGDIKAGYQIVDRIGVRVLRDPYTNKPYVHFYTTKRIGGGVKNFEAIKVLKQKT